MTKASIRQYRPAFFTLPGEPLAAAEFTTLQELLAVPFVARFAALEGFVRYSVSRDFHPRRGRSLLLMAEYTERPRWLVVGYVEGDMLAGLPEWDQPEPEPLPTDVRARDALFQEKYERARRVFQSEGDDHG